jgi:deoxyinosine 3'endonuclease (endonuclease V)
MAVSSPDLTGWELEQIEKSYLVQRSWIQTTGSVPATTKSDLEQLRLAGVDVAWDRVPCTAALVIPGRLGAVEHQNPAQVPPYVPAFLAYREAPLVRSLVLRHKQDLDVLLVDGNGILHPRRFGLASAIGVECGVRTIGVAKTYHWFANTLQGHRAPCIPALAALVASQNSPVTGTWQGRMLYPSERDIRHVMQVEQLTVLPLCMRWRPCDAKARDALSQRLGNGNPGESSLYVDEVLGAAVRTGKRAVNPIYVSIGHGIDLSRAVALVYAAAREHRLPEPLRMADQLARGTLASSEASSQPPKLEISSSFWYLEGNPHAQRQRSPDESYAS